MILSGGIYYLGKTNTPKDSEAKAIIEVNNNTIIQIDANVVDMTAEEFTALIISAVKDKEQLAKNSYGIIKPAKLDSGASITFNNDPALQIYPETIKALPECQVINDEYSESIENRDNLLLQICAMDFDSSKRGWAVVAPDLYNKRIRLQLGPSAKSTELLGKEFIHANVTIIWGINAKKEPVPKLLFLREIVKHNKP